MNIRFSDERKPFDMLTLQLPRPTEGHLLIANISDLLF